MESNRISKQRYLGKLNSKFLLIEIMCFIYPDYQGLQYLWEVSCNWRHLITTHYKQFKTILHNQQKVDLDLSVMSCGYDIQTELLYTMRFG